MLSSEKTKKTGTSDKIPQVLIVGASTRAAAESASKAGIRPICADLFADLDLRAVAEVLPLESYPGGLLAAVETAPNCGWMYTGAIENYPTIITAICKNRPLWGNGPTVLDRVRDPFYLQQILSGLGFPTLKVHNSSSPPPADGNWLVKPMRGAGGRGINLWKHKTARSTTLQEPYYFQQLCRGTEISALFLGLQGDALLIGLARPLDGEQARVPPHPDPPPPGETTKAVQRDLRGGVTAGLPGSASSNFTMEATPGLPNSSSHDFIYHGSIGPIEMSSYPKQITDRIDHIGTHLTRESGLMGLFGIDFLVGSQTPYVVEVNPRYPASAELMERAYGFPLIEWHIRACIAADDKSTTAELQRSLQAEIYAAHNTCHADREPVWAKQILYAPRNFTVPSWDGLHLAGVENALDVVADRPAAGTFIEAQKPVCTVLAKSKSETSCPRLLFERASSIYGHLFHE